jgi:hypothetical protein
LRAPGGLPATGGTPRVTAGALPRASGGLPATGGALRMTAGALPHASGGCRRPAAGS